MASAPPVEIRGTAVSGEPSVLSLEPFATDPDRWLLPVPVDVEAEADEARLWLPRYKVLPSVPAPAAVALEGASRTLIQVQPGGLPLVFAAVDRVRWLVE